MTKESVRLPSSIIAALVASALNITPLYARNSDNGWISYGIGSNNSCGKFISDIQTYPNAKDLYESWLEGYFSGLSQGLPNVVDVIHGTDVNGAEGWIYNYCIKNPTTSYMEAAIKLLLFLHPDLMTTKGQ